jgi:D-beta-D-heptose 7-phosphate kinase / D-beta-D-heptose 1-phosphate adenosyltransferase
MNYGDSFGSMQFNRPEDLTSRSRTSARIMVAVIGDIMIDRYLTGTVNRISPEAPVPILVHRGDHTGAGGAANVAANVVALGCEVRLVGTIGNDRDAEDLKELLVKLQVSADLLVVDPDRPTTCKTRIVSGRQQFFRIDRERTSPLSANIKVKLVAAARSAISQANIVVLSDYAKGTFDENVLAELIGIAKSEGKPVLVDPKRRTFEAYRGADLIKPNAGELAAATGLSCVTDPEIELATKALEHQFDGTVLVTRAEAGMSLHRPGLPVSHFATSVLEVADVSGAGDTALATLAVSLAEGRSLEEATILSNLAAGIAVGKAGTAVVTRAELVVAIERASAAHHHPGSLATIEAAAEMASTWRRMGERVVFTNGCFDLVHAGHIELLASAADQGDRLIVGLNSDASVKRLKGSDRPIQNEVDRARILGALRAVDLVVIFDEATPMSAIAAIGPDVLVKGADYTESEVIGGELVKSRGGRVFLVPLVADRSSTKIAERMRS